MGSWRAKRLGITICLQKNLREGEARAHFHLNGFARRHSGGHIRNLDAAPAHPGSDHPNAVLPDGQDL